MTKNPISLQINDSIATHIKQRMNISPALSPNKDYDRGLQPKMSLKITKHASNSQPISPKTNASPQKQFVLPKIQMQKPIKLKNPEAQSKTPYGLDQ